MTETKITALKNGPLLVNGNVELVNSEGQPISTPGTQFALCRCGGSMKKPFCDGTHSKIGFESAESKTKD